jgi:hypothetical protein
MATTTNYGWTTPDDTALVKDGASAIRTLGSSVDTTTKALNPSTTLGDIEYRSSTANTNTRLGIGSTGNVLTVTGGVPVWAAPAAGGMTLISTTTLTGSTITLSSIPGTYNNLQLLVKNYKPATDNTLLRLRINSDSGVRYRGIHTDNPSNAGSTDSFTNSSIAICANSDDTVATGISIVNIYDYSNAVSWKMLDFTSIAVDPTTVTDFKAFNGFGYFNQTAAITSLDLFPTSGNFTSGTVLLYGVK